MSTRDALLISWSEAYFVSVCRPCVCAFVVLSLSSGNRGPKEAILISHFHLLMPIEYIMKSDDGNERWQQQTS